MQTPALRPTAAFAGAALTVDPIVHRTPSHQLDKTRRAPSKLTRVASTGCCCPAALPRSAAVQLPRWKADVNEQPIRAWRDLASDWKVWMSLALCLLIATVAWLLGYD